MDILFIGCHDNVLELFGCSSIVLYLTAYIKSTVISRGDKRCVSISNLCYFMCAMGDIKRFLYLSPLRCSNAIYWRERISGSLRGLNDVGPLAILSNVKLVFSFVCVCQKTVAMTLLVWVLTHKTKMHSHKNRFHITIVYGHQALAKTSNGKNVKSWTWCWCYSTFPFTLSTSFIEYNV